MGKISSYQSDTAPLVGDYLLGDQASGPTTQRFTIQNLFSLLQKTRNAPFNKGADNASGAIYPGQLESNEIAFSGTPGAYGRLDLLLPQDYVSGTNAVINLVMYSASANNQPIVYYVGSHVTGSTFVSWNVQNNITTGSTINLSTNVIATFPLYTITAANLTAGSLITVAFKPTGAITGTISVTAAYLAYTASV